MTWWKFNPFSWWFGTFTEASKPTEHKAEIPDETSYTQSILVSEPPIIAMDPGKNYYIQLCPPGEKTPNLDLKHAMCDICLTKSLISREALRGSQIEIKPYPFEETVEDEKGQTYKVQGTLPKNLRWRVKNGSRSHPEQFYVVEKLRDNLDALLQKSTISSSGTGAKKDIYVLETPRQTPAQAAATAQGHQRANISRAEQKKLQDQATIKNHMRVKKQNSVGDDDAGEGGSK